MAKIRLVERITPKCESFSPKTVRIGDQIWMAENLAIDDGGEGIYSYEENGEHYYSWHAAMRIAKSIPGWHLPTDEEWVEAAEACGATPGSDGHYTGVEKLKSKLRLTHNRNSCFFHYLGNYANFWTATEDSSFTAYRRYFSAGASMDSDINTKTYNVFSVRLVKD